MVLFRSVSATAAMHMFSCMFGANGIVVPQGVANLPVVSTLVHVLDLKIGKQMFLYSDPLMLVIPLLILVLAAPNIYELMGDYETALMAKPAKHRPTVHAGCFLSGTFDGARAWDIPASFGMLAFVVMTEWCPTHLRNSSISGSERVLWNFILGSPNARRSVRS